MERKHTIEKHSGYWRTERLVNLLRELGINDVIDEGHSCLQRRRNVDFFITPGIITARIYDERPLPYRARLQLEVIDDDSWSKAFEALGEKALFLAKLLGGELPIEVEASFQAVGAPLFPTSGSELTFSCECGRSSSLCRHGAALYLLTSDHFVNDPFSVLTWRGRSREQVLSELRRRRQTLKQTLQLVPSHGNAQLLSYEPASPLAERLTSFWTSGPRLQEISYNIKADELPASLLRRLDALPIPEDLQTPAELALEDSYAHVARRAQSLGLGL